MTAPRYNYLSPRQPAVGFLKIRRLFLLVLSLVPGKGCHHVTSPRAGPSGHHSAPGAGPRATRFLGPLGDTQALTQQQQPCPAFRLQRAPRHGRGAPLTPSLWAPPCHGGSPSAGTRSSESLVRTGISTSSVPFQAERAVCASCGLMGCPALRAGLGCLQVDGGAWGVLPDPNGAKMVLSPAWLLARSSFSSPISCSPQPASRVEKQSYIIKG